ncbi:hypothetical protein [uncultured Mailhella sp.]|uniref:hypothetical protein n=1 Tax=uncultured Mailhella sp. TaxID=1981031 RepID=UPI002621AF26|nr:hypothetical protein [uncultured Mailhella sp.]
MPAEAGQTRRLRYLLADARAVRRLGMWLEGVFAELELRRSSRIFDRKYKMPFSAFFRQEKQDAFCFFLKNRPCLFRSMQGQRDLKKQCHGFAPAVLRFGYLALITYRPNTGNNHKSHGYVHKKHGHSPFFQARNAPMKSTASARTPVCQGVSSFSRMMPSPMTEKLAQNVIK